MKLINKSFIHAIVLALVVSLLLPATALACTSFVLKAADGAAVYGRTMEWGTSYNAPVKRKFINFENR